MDNGGGRGGRGWRSRLRDPYSWRRCVGHIDGGEVEVPMWWLEGWVDRSSVEVVILHWIAMTSPAFRACPVWRIRADMLGGMADWSPAGSIAGGDIEKLQEKASDISLTQDTTAPILTVFIACGLWR